MRRDPLLAVLLVSAPLLVWWAPVPVAALPGLVHWQTLGALAGLMMLSKALELSGILDSAGRALLRHVRGERRLVAALVLFSAALSAVITNDIALFVVVPLTLALRASAVQLPVGRMVVFLALAVNAGSSVSPLGNPQNLFLWQHHELSALAFFRGMLPLSALLMALLLLLIPFAFPARAIQVRAVSQVGPPAHPAARPLLYFGAIAYVPFLLLADAGLALPAALLVALLAAWIHRPLLRQVDVALLLVFLLMFVNTGLLARLPWLVAGFSGLDQGGPVMLAGVALSQAISNVPAALFLTPFTDDWRALAWGVSVGGFGLAIGSLANLIALRLARQPGLLGDFHRWSLTLLALSVPLAWLLLAWTGPV